MLSVVYWNVWNSIWNQIIYKQQLHVLYNTFGKFFEYLMKIFLLCIYVIWMIFSLYVLLFRHRWRQRASMVTTDVYISTTKYNICKITAIVKVNTAICRLKNFK
jgi:hypothetical protein